MDYDYHVHTTYSDGSDLDSMCEAAREAGLDGVGFADHCNVSADAPGTELPHDLDETFRARRRDIEGLRAEFDLRIFDAVEMDYRPADEERIEEFLAAAEFDYVVGSVHHVDGREVMAPGQFVDVPEDDRAGFVDRYFDRVIDLVSSGLFDVVAHVDLPERNPELRGYASEGRYRDVAAAVSDSRAVPEINAGRVFGGLGELHPVPPFLDVLRSEGIRFVTGTDSHTPEEVVKRTAHLSEFVEEREIRTVRL